MKNKIFSIIRISFIALFSVMLAVSVLIPNKTNDAIIKAGNTIKPGSEIIEAVPENIDETLLVFPELKTGKIPEEYVYIPTEEEKNIPMVNYEQKTVAQSDEEQKIITKYVNMLKKLHGSYSVKIEAQIQGAINEFYSLPNEEHTRENKERIVKARILTLSALKDTCDSEVNSILESMRKELEGINAPTTAVEEARSTYESMKNAEISKYMTKYSNR